MASASELRKAEISHAGSGLVVWSLGQGQDLGLVRIFSLREVGFLSRRPVGLANRRKDGSRVWESLLLSIRTSCLLSPL